MCYLLRQVSSFLYFCDFSIIIYNCAGGVYNNEKIINIPLVTEINIRVRINNMVL
jgi:hypothetical protein